VCLWDGCPRLLLGRTVRGVDFSPALAEAIAARDATALADLFAAGADPASADEDDSFLLVAASTGDVELVRAFLDAGLPVDTENRYGTTALIAAALDGHLPLAEFLLARGADPDRAQFGSSESGTALTWAIGGPDAVAWVEALLAAGADPNLPRLDGWTPLMLAASFGPEALVRRLLDADADVLADARDGELNALGAARYRNHEEIIQLLLERGAVEPVEPGARQLPAALAELEQWRAAHPPGPPSEPGPGDAEVDAAAERLAGVVDDIVAWFAEHAPPAASWIEAARGGADAAGIAAAEAAIGARLPASVRAYLRLFGATAGIGIAEYDGLSLDRALDHWRMLEKLRAEGTFAAWPPRETTPGNGFVQFTWWHPGWLPFAMDGAGNLFCIDLAPAERGTVGQVISWEKHAGPTGPIRPTIEDYLRRYLDRMREGEYDFNPATGFAYGGE